MAKARKAKKAKRSSVKTKTAKRRVTKTKAKKSAAKRKMTAKKSAPRKKAVKRVRKAPPKPMSLTEQVSGAVQTLVDTVAETMDMRRKMPATQSEE
jgi:hypothetical protein